MYAFAVVLILLTCGAEFTMTYKIPSSSLYQSGSVGEGESNNAVNNHLPVSHHSSNTVLDDGDHGRMILKKANRNYFIPDFVPLPEEQTFNDNNFYSIAPPGHPSFYANAQMNNLPEQHYPIFNENHAAEPFRGDYLYTHLSNPSQEFPPADYGIEDIRYVPLVQQMSFFKPVTDNTQQLPIISTPIPYEHILTSNIPPAPSAIEEDMVKKIMQIVSDFEKFNGTQVESAFREDLVPPMKNTSATFITSTTAEKNNTTKVESTIKLDTDESKTEIHSNGNRTESSQVIHVDAMTSSTTEKPLRYVIDNFIDQNGNPCAKEVVQTAEKKTYYVYTCEEKGIPQASTPSSSVTQYRDELHTTKSDTIDNAKDVSTTPMTAEDHTLPETHNDYVVYNSQ